MTRLLLIVVTSLLFGTAPWGIAHADPRQGSYSLALSVDQANVASGGGFVLHAVIEQGPNPSYQALQWRFRYDPAFVRVDAAAPSGGAPSVCAFTSATEPEVLLGCIDLSGPFVDFSGSAFDVQMTCLADSSVEFVLDPGSTFVAGAETTLLERHLHSAIVNCGSGGPTVVVPTATVNPQAPPPAPVPTGDSRATPIPITPEALTPAATSEAAATAAASQTAQDGAPSAASSGTADSGSDGGAAEGDDDGGGSRVWLWIVVVAVGGLAAAAGMAYLFTKRRA